MSKKIELDEKVELELSEREEKIYDKGKEDGFNKGALVMLLATLGFLVMILIMAVICKIIN